MSKLMSLLCCSVDSTDDAADRYAAKKQLSPDRSSVRRTISQAQSGEVKLQQKSSYPVTSKDNTKSNNKSTTSTKPTKDKTDSLDDDNSVNETDTITNNDGSNEIHQATPMNGNHNTTTSTTNNSKKSEHSSNSNNNHRDESKSNNEPHTDNRTQTESKKSTSNGNQVNSSDIITSVSPDQPLGNIVYEDNNEMLDLTRIQEGQSFDPETGFLLGKKDTARFGKKKCLILDLDETLVHSSFKYLRIADFVIPVQIDNQVHHVYVIKRPGVDEFLEKVGKWFEVVVFTASVLKYGDPLLDKLDIHNSVHHRLFRDSCYNYQGNFIKNLSQIGRPLADSIIIDNSPASYFFHPQHSIPISSWFSDTHDNELLDLLPFLEDISKQNVDDVALVLDISM